MSAPKGLHLLPLTPQEMVLMIHLCERGYKGRWVAYGSTVDETLALELDKNRSNITRPRLALQRKQLVIKEHDEQDRQVLRVNWSVLRKQCVEAVHQADIRRMFGVAWWSKVTETFPAEKVYAHHDRIVADMNNDPERRDTNRNMSRVAVTTICDDWLRRRGRTLTLLRGGEVV